jgi:hypothetical protein
MDKVQKHNLFNSFTFVKCGCLSMPVKVFATNFKLPGISCMKYTK